MGCGISGLHMHAMTKGNCPIPAGPVHATLLMYISLCMLHQRFVCLGIEVSQAASMCFCAPALPPTALRAIDLLSQMLGPVVSGLLMSYSSLFTAVVVLTLYSLGAWLPEALLLQAAHRHSPRLR